MRKRNFFRYTFTPRVLRMGSALAVLVCLVVVGAFRVLHWPRLGFTVLGLYAVFCALFLISSAVKYIHYKNYKH